MDIVVKVIFVFFLTGVLGSNTARSSLPLTLFEQGVGAFEEGDYKKSYNIFLPLANEHNLLAQEYIRYLIIKDKVTPKDETEITFSASAPSLAEAEEWVEASLWKMKINNEKILSKKSLEKLENLGTYCSYAAYILGDYYYQLYLVETKKLEKETVKPNKKKTSKSGDLLDKSKYLYEHSEKKGGYRATLKRYELRKEFRYSGSDLEDLKRYRISLIDLIEVKDEGERCEKLYKIPSMNRQPDSFLLSGGMHGNRDVAQFLFISKDNPALLRCLEALGHSGSPDVLLYLGLIHYNNFKNISQARFWFTKGWKQGIAECGDCLSSLYFSNKQYEEARNVFEKLAEQGQDQYFNELGVLYQDGLVGTSQEENDKQAVTYFQKAKTPEGYKNLVVMMRQNRGGLKNDEKETSFLENLAGPEALYLLGQHYHNTNPELAEGYYRRASRQDHDQAFATLFELQVNKTKPLEEKEKIFHQIRVLAELEYSREIELLYGSLLYFGVGDIVKRNDTLARQYIDKAAQTLKSAKAFQKRIEEIESLRSKLRDGTLDIFKGEKPIVFAHYDPNIWNEVNEAKEENSSVQIEEEKKIKEEEKNIEENIEKKKEESLTNNDEGENWQNYMDFEQYKNKKNMNKKETRFVDNNLENDNKTEKEIDKELEEFMNTKQVKPKPLNQILNLMTRFVAQYGGKLKPTSNGFLLKKGEEVTSFHNSHGRNKDLGKGPVKEVLNFMKENNN